MFTKAESEMPLFFHYWGKPGFIANNNGPSASLLWQCKKKKYIWIEPSKVASFNFPVSVSGLDHKPKKCS